MSELLNEAKRRAAAQMDLREKAISIKNTKDDEVRVSKEGLIDLLESLESFFQELREQGIKIDYQAHHLSRDDEDKYVGSVVIGFSFKDHPVRSEIFIVGQDYSLNPLNSYAAGNDGFSFKSLRSESDIRGYLEEIIFSYLSHYPESLV